MSCTNCKLVASYGPRCFVGVCSRFVCVDQNPSSKASAQLAISRDARDDSPERLARRVRGELRASFERRLVRGQWFYV